MKGTKHILAILACLLLCTASQAVQRRKEPGARIPESVLPTDRDDPTLWTLQPVKSTRAASPGQYATTTDIPRTGTVECLLILADFNDCSFRIKDDHKLVQYYERVFNEHGYIDPNIYERNGVKYPGVIGSVNDYFRAQSYGQYDPVFNIIGPIHLTQGYSSYGKNDSYQMDIRGVKAMVREICDSLSARGMNLAGYASKGAVHQFSIIYAGKGENSNSSDPNLLWPQASTLSYTYYDKDNNRIPLSIEFSCSCELFWDTDTIPDGIGTFCHEFSHTLGLPDFYNTISEQSSESNSAMGFWSLMDYGSYENGGFSPVGYTAFEKYSLGWMDIEEIGYDGLYYLNDISRKPDPESGIHSAYRLNTGNDNQFIILENHLKTGWYKYHAAEGLMVTAVNYSKDSWQGNILNTNSSDKRYHILPADNNSNRYTNAGDLFPYYATDSITTLGTPKLKAGQSFPSYSIYNIRRQDSLVTFLAGKDLPSNVENPKQQGTTVTVYDISGKPVLKTTTTDPEHISLPGHGIYIVKYGNVVRKITQ